MIFCDGSLKIKYAAVVRNFKVIIYIRSVIAVAFKIVFRAKIHANDIFLFFKNYF
jgi:hypothetical protein